MRGTHPSTTMLDPMVEMPYTYVKTVSTRHSNEQRTGQVDPPEGF